MPATIQDVARAAGVSVGTVSRAMNNYTDVSAKTRERILQAAQRLGYSPNVMARNLSSKHLKNIALILSGAMEEEMFNHFDIMLMRGCFEFASKKGLDVSIHTIDAKIQREKSYEQLCYEYNLAGAVLMGLKVTEPYYCESLAKCKQPCVLIDLEPVGEYVSTVTIDHVAAFDEMTQYLIDKGHRKIVLVAGRKNAMVTMERLAGAYQAMERNGLCLTGDHIIYTDFLKQEAYCGVRRYFESHPPDSVTAFLCMSDMLAIGTIDALKSKGYRVPRDYSVTGYDGLELTTYTDPRITTIDQNIQQKGYEAAKLLFEMLEGRRAQRLVLPYTLRKRASVRNINRAE